MVMVFAGEKDNKEVLSGITDADKCGRFSHSIYWENATNSRRQYMLKEQYPYCLAVTVVEFYVPEELFAEKPKTFFQKLIWRWANWLHSGAPVDQCEYRKRKIIAVPKLVIGIIYMLWKFFIVLGGSVYFSIVSGFLFFIGFRPLPFWESILAIIKGEYCDWKIKEMRIFNNCHNPYKMWQDREIAYDSKRNVRIIVKEEKRIFLAPWEVCILVTSALSIVAFLSIFREEIFIVFAFFGSMVIGSYLVFWTSPFVSKYFEKSSLVGFWKRMEEEKTKKRNAKYEKRCVEKRDAIIRRAKEYQVWLEKNYSMNREVNKVNLKNLPVPLTNSERATQFFKVSFWALKAKVCKPYSSQ